MTPNRLTYPPALTKAAMTEKPILGENFHVLLSGPAIETTEKDTEKGHQHGLGRRTRPDPNGLIPLSATCRLRGTAGEGDGWKPMSDGTNRPKGPGAIWTNQIAGGYPIRES